MADEETAAATTTTTQGESRGGEWKKGLFGCFGDFKLCIITYFVPCYTFGKTAETLGESCLVYGLLMCVPIVDIICGIMIRGKIRERKNIEGSIVSDVLLWLCCPLCALCQEAQEMNSLGAPSSAMAVDGEAMERQ